MQVTRLRLLIFNRDTRAAGLMIYIVRSAILCYYFVFNLKFIIVLINE